MGFLSGGRGQETADEAVCDWIRAQNFALSLCSANHSVTGEVSVYPHLGCGYTLPFSCSTSLASFVYTELLLFLSHTTLDIDGNKHIRQLRIVIYIYSDIEMHIMEIYDGLLRLSYSNSRPACFQLSPAHWLAPSRPTPRNGRLIPLDNGDGRAIHTGTIKIC